MFKDELADIFHLDYTRGNCIMKCRIQSILALCGCVPFNVPYTGTNKYPITHCTLEHIACLNQYRGIFYGFDICLCFVHSQIDFGYEKIKQTISVKWSTVVFSRSDVAGLEREIQDGLFCVECLPSCSGTQYSVSTTSLPLTLSMRNNTNLL